MELYQYSIENALHFNSPVVPPAPPVVPPPDNPNPLAHHPQAEGRCNHYKDTLLVHSVHTVSVSTLQNGVSTVFAQYRFYTEFLGLLLMPSAISPYDRSDAEFYEMKVR